MSSIFKYTFFILTAVFISSCASPAPPIPNYVSGVSLAFDDRGSIYVLGRFHGNVDFDPGPGVSKRQTTSQYGSDAFISKFDENGDFNLVCTWGSDGALDSSSVTPANIGCLENGDLIISGLFEGYVDFDPGNALYTCKSSFSDSSFILQLTSSCDLISVQQWDGIFNNTTPYMKLTESNVITTGCFSGSVDFDPGLQVSHYEAGPNGDAYFSLFDIDGNFKYTKTWGGLGKVGGTCITVDERGNIYIGGVFSDDTDFDPGTGIEMKELDCNYCFNIFVSSFDAEGNFRWVRTWGDQVNDYPISLISDRNGRIILSGRFYGTVDFDHGPDTQQRTSDAADCFILALTEDGDYLNVRTWGGPKNDTVTDVEYKGEYFYITGTYKENLNVENTNETLDAVGGEDIYLMKFDEAFNLIWLYGLNGPDEEICRDIEIYENEFFVIIGSFSGDVDFDPGVGEANLSSNESADAFLAKYNLHGNLLWARSWGD